MEVHITQGMFRIVRLKTIWSKITIYACHRHVPTSLIILKPVDEHDHGLFLDEFQQPANWMLHYELLTLVLGNKAINA